MSIVPFMYTKPSEELGGIEEKESFSEVFGQI